MKTTQGNLMLALIALAIGWDWILLPANATAQDLEFPYTALVHKPETLIRSGPAALHYATEALAPGDTVEVYRHDPGGWAAIRPPAGSFSLVPATAVELEDEATGRILEDGTRSWVGTRQGAVEAPLWQVKLKKDERVEILGEISWPDPAGHSTVWYQIAPPAGEFRWVKLSRLQRPKADLEFTADEISAHQRAAEADVGEPLDTAAPPTDPATRPANFLESDTDSNFVQPANYQTTQRSAAEHNQGWRKATHRIERVAANTVQGSFSDSTGFTTPDPATRAARQVPLSRGNSEFASHASPPALATPSNLPSGPLANQLRALDVRLSQEMLKPPTQWRLEELKLNTERLYRLSTNNDEKQFAERMMQKIRGCEQLRLKYRQAANLGPAANTIVGDLPGTVPVGSGIDPNVEFGTTYDAHGWLVELKQAGGTLPPAYVLKDDNDKITHHVAPAPGFNLRRYLNTRVGIIGTRGFHQAYNLKHVTAERVVDLTTIR